MEHIYVNILKKQIQDGHSNILLDYFTHEWYLDMDCENYLHSNMDDKCVEHMQTMMDVGRYVLGLLTVTGG